MADCVAALREQTAQLCGEMLQSINESETGVHQKTLNRLIRFIDEFKQMNFVNDTEMEQRLQAVRKEDRLSLRTIRQFCIKTAREIATEHHGRLAGVERVKGDSAP